MSYENRIIKDGGIRFSDISTANDLNAVVSEGATDEFVRIICFLEGKCSAMLNGNAYSLCEGSIFIADRGDSLLLNLCGKTRYYTVSFLPDELLGGARSSLDQERPISVLYDIVQKRIFSKEDFTNTEVYTAFNRIMGEWNGQRPGYELLIRSHLLFLIAKLYRSVCATNASLPSRSSNPAIDRAMLYVSSNLDSVNEQNAAEDCGLSAAYFSTLFKSTVGMNFAEYVTRARISRAKALLSRTDKSVAFIAYEVGFSSSSHFISKFRAFEGITPAKYRSARMTSSKSQRRATPVLNIQFDDSTKKNCQFLMLKYRTDSKSPKSNMPFFLNSNGSPPSANDLSWVTLVTDGKWHVAVINMDKTAQFVRSYTPDENGCYSAKHVKFNLFHLSSLTTEYFDLSYIGFAESIEEACRTVSRDDDVAYGYFDHTNWIDLPFRNEELTESKLLPDSYYLDSKAIFEQAVSNGTAIQSVEQLNEFGMDFVRIRYS